MCVCVCARAYIRRTSHRSPTSFLFFLLSLCVCACACVHVLMRVALCPRLPAPPRYSLSCQREVTRGREVSGGGDAGVGGRDEKAPRCCPQDTASPPGRPPPSYPLCTFYRSLWWWWTRSCFDHDRRTPAPLPLPQATADSGQSLDKRRRAADSGSVGTQEEPTRASTSATTHGAVAGGFAPHLCGSIAFSPALVCHVVISAMIIITIA